MSQNTPDITTKWNSLGASKNFIYFMVPKWNQMEPDGAQIGPKGATLGAQMGPAGHHVFRGARQDAKMEPNGA